MKRTLRMRRLTAAMLSAVCATALAQVQQWPDPVAEHVIPAPKLGLAQGPMLGRPSATSVRVWVRTEKPTEFEIRYATELPLDADSPSVKGRSEAARDNIGIVDLTGLAPYQTYYYGVVLNGDLSIDKAATDKLRAQMAEDAVGIQEIFNRGGTIEQLKRRCEAETGLPAPAQPQIQIRI